MRERERGTLEQLQVTPATRTEIILGKILPFTLIGYVQLTMVILLMRFLFDIPIQGSVRRALRRGPDLHRRGARPRHADLDASRRRRCRPCRCRRSSCCPFVFLSGYVFPIDGMPTIFQYISRIIPARYFIEVLRGIILRGAGLAELWRPIAWLAFYTILIIGLAVARFKKTALAVMPWAACARATTDLRSRGASRRPPFRECHPTRLQPAEPYRPPSPPRPVLEDDRLPDAAISPGLPRPARGRRVDVVRRSEQRAHLVRRHVLGHGPAVDGLVRLPRDALSRRRPRVARGRGRARAVDRRRRGRCAACDARGQQSVGLREVPGDPERPAA